MTQPSITETSKPKTIDEDPINGKYYIAKMDHTGDYKVMWSKDNADEVAMARQQFDELRKKGYAAFAVEGKNGEKGKQITKFDPEMERIIMVPPMQGG